MKIFIFSTLMTLAISTGTHSTPVSAQFYPPSTEATQQSSTTREERIAALFAANLTVSRLPEIYTDLRYSLRELYLPNLRQLLAENTLDKFDDKAAPRLRAFIAAIENGLKAADELDPVLEEKKPAFFGDVAAWMAKYVTTEEIGLAERTLQTPAARKGFNTFYAASRLITGYTLEDVRQSQQMSRWMMDLEIDPKTNPFTDKDAPPPPRERVIKAEAVVSDILRISRVDDMVSDITHFVRQVVLQAESLPNGEREEIQAGLQQFEFSYNLGKSMALAAAPSILASKLNDDQLGKFHLLVLSPFMAKSFGLFHNVIREATSFTKQDLDEIGELAEEAERHHSSIDPGAKRLMEEEWAALAEKWREILLNSLSPETRESLEESINELQMLNEDHYQGRRRASPRDPLHEKREL